MSRPCGYCPNEDHYAGVIPMCDECRATATDVAGWSEDKLLKYFDPQDLGKSTLQRFAAPLDAVRLIENDRFGGGHRVHQRVAIRLLDKGLHTKAVVFPDSPEEIEQLKATISQRSPFDG